MVWLTLTFHFLMLGIDLLSLVALRAKPRPIMAWAAVFNVLVASGIFALILAPEAFFAMRLLAYGIFLHLPAVVAMAAYQMRQNFWKTAWLFGLAAIVVVLVGVDAFVIEPHWLEVTRYQLASPKISKPLRLVLIADLQTDEFGDYERDVFRRVMEAEPQMVMMAGDYLQAPSSDYERLRRLCNEYLREIGFAAPLGIFAVGGNSDSPEWQSIFGGLDVTTISHTQRFEMDGLVITGLSVQDSFNTGMIVPPEQLFHIALGHAPDYALGRVEADLLLAGHTHGGQVCLPGIGPLLTLSRVPRSWASGLTQLTDGRTLVVSRGVGMERVTAPRLRFLCRPQLVILDLVPTQDQSGLER